MVGGYAEGNGDLDSCEQNISGERGWRISQPLPWPLSQSRGVSLLSQFYITGDMSIYRNFQTIIMKPKLLTCKGGQ